MKAKERSFKREKEELQRENNNLAKQLKILETEVLNFMRSQGIEDADSFDSEVDDELESMDKFPNLCVSNQHTVPHILIYKYIPHNINTTQSHSHTVTQSHSQPHSHRVINI